uniref:Uncharacterized protein n=4 Tax=Guillardia theta TaxID=55529 RepID=A0A7S4UDA5_GUITH|mmetsp:Transcript_6356/g.22653  ORF Transcript_6356/g.22653 Transcript_6356/m.22653 type:complete len:293 (+) Transcript_6356:97-975(+)
MRGDHFYRTRDYRAALNAYTSCLQLDTRNAQAYSNRSLCSLRLFLFADVIADASKALDLFKKVKKEGKDPEDWAQELEKRARCLLRRGTAYTRLGMFDLALQDLDAASKLLPDNELIKDDLEGLREAIAQHPYVKAKEEGDRAFKQGNTDEAIRAYDAAIDADGGCFQALSNRAACWLAKEEYVRCIEDSTEALMLLDPSGHFNTKLALRLLVRRGTARCWHGDFEEGRADFKRALLLDPHNKQLQDDVSMLVTTTGAAKSLSEFMGSALPDARSHALAALEAAGIQRPPGA